MAENDALSHKNEDDQIKITVLPPTNANNNITDEGSDDKNGSGAINNLSGSKLLASAELDHERRTMTEVDDKTAKKKTEKESRKTKAKLGKHQLGQ